MNMNNAMMDFEQGDQEAPMESAKAEMKKVMKDRVPKDANNDVQVDLSPIIEKVSALKVTQEVADQITDVIATVGKDSASVAKALHAIAGFLEPKTEDKAPDKAPEEALGQL